MLSFFDLILALIIFCFFWFGFWYGLIYSVGSIFGIVVGAWTAGHYYLVAANWVSDNPGNFLKVVAFILVFGIANRLVGLVFWLINKIFDILTIIPFLKTINRLAGGILGLGEGFITLGLVIYIYSRYPFNDWISNQLTNSQIAPIALKTIIIIKPFLPEILTQLKSLI